MPATADEDERKPYTPPTLRSFGSIVATTSGSQGTKTDGLMAKKP
jgi:hypothetical protein